MDPSVSSTEGTILVRRHGPFRVSGRFRIVDHDGQPFDLAGRDSISLCRCGQSANRPFCDGSHKKIGFQSDDKARALPPLPPPPAASAPPPAANPGSP